MPPLNVPKEVLDFWDFRIREDLKHRMSALDVQWQKNAQLIRNTGGKQREGGGYRYGNLAAEFIRTMQYRLLQADPQVQVQPDDPDYSSQAENVSIVSQSVCRNAGLKRVLRETVKAATWASLGWIGVGHPADPLNLDMMRSLASPNTSGPSMEGGSLDSYEPVSIEELGSQGINTDQIAPFNPFEDVPQTMPGEAEPVPLFQPGYGYPYLECIDPRLIVTNHNAQSRENFDYICRLRFLTIEELKALRGFDYPGKTGMLSEFRALFQAVEGQDPKFFPSMLMIAELYIVRDRNNPWLNGARICYVVGEADQIIHQELRPSGGMVPLIPLKLSDLKDMYDTTLAEELAPYADIFDKGIQAMFRAINRMLNKKWNVPQNSGLSETDEKRLNNDNYTGPIKSNDPDRIKQLVEEKMDHALLQNLSWVKSLAQSASGASDLDRGQAIKDITARQTQALLEATGINVDGMKEALSAAAQECVIKLMHLIGMYNHAGRSRKYSVGKHVASFDRGMHDFTSSYIYDVKVRDSGESVSNEERLVWVQFLRLITADTSNILAPFLDREALAVATVRRFGEGPELLASRSAGRQPQGTPNVPPEIMALQGGQMGSVTPFPGANSGAALQDQSQGQHPERDTGGRGLDLSNALSGLGRIGGGMGE